MHAHATDVLAGLTSRLSLSELASALDHDQARAALSRVNADGIDRTLLGALNRSTYTRYELIANEHVLIVLIAWLPGQASPAHDHGGSSCTFRVLHGTATEQRFERRRDGRVTLVEEDRFLPGSVVSCEGDDIHAIVNDSDQSQLLITLHVYRPCPAMREYVIVDGSDA